MKSFPKIYPITDTRLSGLSHFAQVKLLVEGGASVIQLRDKSASSDEFFEAAREVCEFARPLNIRIIINDRVDIALAAGADGVHLGQDDLPPEKAREILGSGAIIGLSTHDPAQAAAALSLPLDYLAIGPVFETGTKNSAESAVGIEGIRSVRSVIGDHPLVAIGGINRNNFSRVLAAGADSAAVISDILRDPVSIVSSMADYVDKARYSR